MINAGLLGIGLSLAATAGAQPMVGWSLSASSTDPLLNTVPLTGEVIPLYLWLYCAEPSGGIAAARFSMLYLPTVTVFSFEPRPGVVNSGSTDDLFLSISGCPRGSFLAGQFLVQGPPVGEFNICLGPFGDPPEANVSYGCTVPSQPLENATIGFAAGHDQACSHYPDFFEFCLPTVSVDALSWGRITSPYRAVRVAP